MIVVLGATGYIGTAFVKELKVRKHIFLPVSRKDVDYTNFNTLLTFFKKVQPSFVINAAGYTGKPNVDVCESTKIETINGNILLPQIIAQACSILNIPFGHVSSGCIYNGIKENGYTENDIPNFTFKDSMYSFYSGCKALGEEAIKGIGQSYIWRLRIPFDEFNNPRNFLTKIQNYQKVYDNVNSISHRKDFVCACLDLWQIQAPFGIYNITNPGFITTREVVILIQKYLKSNKEFKYWNDDKEFYKFGAKTPRSNCILDVTKLLKTGVQIRTVNKALEDSLINWVC